MAIIYREATPEDGINYFNSYMDTLHTFISEWELTPSSMKENLEIMLNQDIHVIIAIDEEKDEVVGTCTVIVEQKLLRWGAKAAHIEELITRKERQGKWIGKTLVNLALDLAKQHWCYKMIADTRDELVPRFEKFGFDSPERMIRKYL